MCTTEAPAHLRSRQLRQAHDAAFEEGVDVGACDDGNDFRLVTLKAGDKSISYQVENVFVVAQFDAVPLPGGREDIHGHKGWLGHSARNPQAANGSPFSYSGNLYTVKANNGGGDGSPHACHSDSACERGLSGETPHGSRS